MSPVQLNDYHDVLAHGTFDDIHNFAAQTKMHPLNPASVNEWVARRDDVVKGIAPSDYADPMFHPEVNQDQIHLQNVQEHVAQQTSKWKPTPT